MKEDGQALLLMAFAPLIEAAEEAAQRRQRRRNAGVEGQPQGVMWAYYHHRVYANTKSEARARLKPLIGGKFAKGHSPRRVK